MNLDRIRIALPGRAIHYYASVDSTMNAAAAQPLGTIILADAQTAGQGRHGRLWYSEAGSGLYCSVVLRAKPLLTLALGLAAARAITAVTGIECDLRWPNDVMVGGRKTAGVLVQVVSEIAVGGIGINVNHTVFPAELAAEATSLRLHAGREFLREDLLMALIPSVETFAPMDSATILRLFTRASSYAAGRRVVVDGPDGIFKGVTAGLNPAGYLVVRRDDGTDTLVVTGPIRAAGA